MLLNELTMLGNQTVHDEVVFAGVLVGGLPSCLMTQTLPYGDIAPLGLGWEFGSHHLSLSTILSNDVSDGFHCSWVSLRTNEPSLAVKTYLPSHSLVFWYPTTSC